MGERWGGEGVSTLDGGFIDWDDNDNGSWGQAAHTGKMDSGSNALRHRRTFRKGSDTISSSNSNDNDNINNNNYSYNNSNDKSNSSSKHNSNNNKKKVDDRILPVINAFRNGNHNSFNSGIGRSKSNEHDIYESKSRTIFTDDCGLTGNKFMAEVKRSSSNNQMMAEALVNSRNKPIITPATIGNRNLKRANSVPTSAVERSPVVRITPNSDSCRPIVKMYRSGGNPNKNNNNYGENNNPSIVTSIRRSRLKTQDFLQGSTHGVLSSVPGFRKRAGIRDGVTAKNFECEGADFLFDEREIGYAADDSKWQCSPSRNCSSQPSPDSTACDSISQSSLYSHSHSHSQPLALNGEERGWRKKRKIMNPLPLFSSSNAISASHAKFLSSEQTASPPPLSPATPLYNKHSTLRDQNILTNQNDQSCQGSEVSEERNDFENNWRSKRKLRRTCSSPLPSSSSFAP